MFFPIVERTETLGCTKKGIDGEVGSRVVISTRPEKSQRGILNKVTSTPYTNRVGDSLVAKG